jgi:hypothetical protein
MPKITIGVEGVKTVRKGLENLSADIPKVSIERVGDSADNIIAVMQKYPRKLPNQRYVRTGELGRKTTKKKVTNMGYAVQVDPVYKGKHYGKYVVGNAYGEEQAGIHAGRWKLFYEVVMKEGDKLVKNIDRAIKGAIKARGF